MQLRYVLTNGAAKFQYMYSVYNRWCEPSYMMKNNKIKLTDTITSLTEMRRALF